MKTTNFPPLKPEPLLYIDATPDENYPLRILQAYRQNCNCKYEYTNYNTKTDNEIVFWDMMNEIQDQRAEILDNVITKLSK